MNSPENCHDRAPFCFRFKGDLIGKLNLLTAVYILSGCERGGENSSALRVCQNEIRKSFGARKTWQRFPAFAHGTDWFVWQAGVCIGKKSELKRAFKILIQKGGMIIQSQSSKKRESIVYKPLLLQCVTQLKVKEMFPVQGVLQKLESFTNITERLRKEGIPSTCARIIWWISVAGG